MKKGRLMHGCLACLCTALVMFAGCARRDRVYDVAEYRKTKFAKWVSLPDDAYDIRASAHYVRDVNYTFVLCNRTDIAASSPAQVIDASIAVNVQHRDQPILRRRVGMLSFESLCHGFKAEEGIFPGWWPRSELERFNDVEVAFWQHSGYGYGYIVWSGPEEKGICVLRFSRQHLTFDTLTEMLQP